MSRCVECSSKGDCDEHCGVSKGELIGILWDLKEEIKTIKQEYECLRLSMESGNG